MITSWFGSTLSKSCATAAPIDSTPRGMSVAGPTSVTALPSSLCAQRLDRATRLWRMSPTSATFSPSNRPNRSRIVKRSRRACVGCSFEPSPALITAPWIQAATRCGAPDDGWRTTAKSTPIASIVCEVSRSDSAFERLDPAGERSMTSAPRARAAMPKEVRVRVLDSAKKVRRRLPRRVAGGGLALYSEARERTASRSPRVKSRIPRRCRRVQPAALLGVRAIQGSLESGKYSEAAPSRPEQFLPHVPHLRAGRQGLEERLLPRGEDRGARQGGDAEVAEDGLPQALEAPPRDRRDGDLTSRGAHPGEVHFRRDLQSPFGAGRLPGVADPQGQRGPAGGLAGEIHGGAVQVLVRLGKPGRVDEPDGKPVERDDFGDRIARGARDFGDERPVSPRQSVEERRLPGIRAAGDDDGRRIDQRAPRLRGLQESFRVVGG